MSEIDNTDIFGLTDVEVATLGLVTRGANKEEFFMLKSEGKDAESADDENEMQKSNQSEMEEKVTKSVWNKLIGLFKQSIEKTKDIKIEDIDTEKLDENINAEKACEDENKSVDESAETGEGEDENESMDTNMESETLKGENKMPDNEELISKADFEKAQNEIAFLKAEVEKSREREARQVWLNKAVEIGYAPVASTELADHLYNISKLDAKEVDWVVDLLKSYDNLLKDSGMFSDFGTARVVDESDPIVKAINSGDTKAALLSMDRKTALSAIEEMRAYARKSK